MFWYDQNCLSKQYFTSFYNIPLNQAFPQSNSQLNNQGRNRQTSIIIAFKVEKRLTPNLITHIPIPLTNVLKFYGESL